MGGKKNAGRNAAETANQFTQMGIDTLDPFLQAGTGQLGALTQGASVGGLDERLRDIFSSDTFGGLFNQRKSAIEGQLSAGGLTRSGTAIQAAANIPTDLALFIENLMTGRSQNLAGQGLGAGGGIAGLFTQQGQDASAGQLGDAQTRSNVGSNILKIASGIFFGSDERLKVNAVKVMQLGVLPVYEWDWIPEVRGTVLEDGPRIGFMAGDVEREFPQHVAVWRGWKVVNYMAVLDELQANLNAKIAREAA